MFIRGNRKLRRTKHGRVRREVQLKKNSALFGLQYVGRQGAWLKIWPKARRQNRARSFYENFPPSCSSRKHIKTILGLPNHIYNMTNALCKSMSLLWHDKKTTLTLQQNNIGHVVDFERERGWEGISTNIKMTYYEIIMIIKSNFSW